MTPFAPLNHQVANLRTARPWRPGGPAARTGSTMKILASSPGGVLCVVEH